MYRIMKYCCLAILSLVFFMTYFSARGCTFNSLVIQDGASFSPNFCMSCTCSDGQLSCVQEICPYLQCGTYETLTELEGKCCPVCIPNTAMEAPFQSTTATTPPACREEGVTKDPLDPCLRCSCQQGNRLCWDISENCEALSCNKIVYVSGECCPQCETTPTKHLPCEIEGSVIAPWPHGSVIHETLCTTCTCDNGTLNCTEALDCPHPTNTQSSLQLSVTPKRCRDGIRKVLDCEKCWCLLGEFRCIFDKTLCRKIDAKALRHWVTNRLILGVRVLLGVSFNRRLLAEEVRQILQDKNMEVLSIWISFPDKPTSEVMIAVEYRKAQVPGEDPEAH